MLPVERVIGESGLTAMPGSARLDVRLPWYRSLPLSTVRIEHLALDGCDVPLETVRFELGGRSVLLAELEDLTNDFWFVLDSAFLTFPAEVAAGSAHDVDLTIGVYPPYIPGMKRANSQRERLRAGEPG